MKIGASRLMGLLVVIAGLSGCSASAPVTKVDDIATNKVGYLQSNFDPQQLPAGVTQGLAGDPITLPFRKLTVKGQVTLNKFGDAKVETYMREATYINAGNGLIQQIYEWSRNDIPYASDYNLNFIGLFSLRSQNVSYNSKQPGKMWELDSMTRLDRAVAHPQARGTYVFEGKEGSNAYSTSCSADKLYPASAVNPALTGQAMNVVCTYSTNGLAKTKSTYVYLTEYGLYLAIAHASSSENTTFGIDLISAE